MKDTLLDIIAYVVLVSIAIPVAAAAGMYVLYSNFHSPVGSLSGGIAIYLFLMWAVGRVEGE
jgi:hypothetical protein